MTPTLLALCLSAAPALADAWAPPRRATEAYSDALVALGRGEAEAAQAGFEALVAQEPGCGMCAQGLGVARLRTGDIDGAIETLEQAAARWPDQPEVWASLSAATFVVQDFARAREAAEAAIRVDPGSLDGHAALQQVLLRTGDLEAADAVLAGARDALPDPVLACFELQIGQERKATPDPARVEACRRAGTPDLMAGALSRAGDASQLGALAARLGLDPVVLVAQAMDQLGDGDLESGLSLLDKVLEEWPHRADARALRAQVRREAGDLPGALADLEVLLGAGSWVDVHRTGAMSGILRKSDAQRLAGTIAEAAALHIDLLLEEDALEDAAAAWSSAERLPAHPAILAAGARLALAQGDPPAAWARVAQGLQTFPTDPRPVSVAGAVALADPAGLTVEARDALLRSVDWRDGYNLALVFRKRGAPADCFARTRSADAASGLPGEARRRLRMLGYACAVEASDWPAAQAAFQRLSDPAKASPVARYNHALALHQAGDNDQAALTLEGLPMATDLDPGVRAAVRALGLRVAVARAAWDHAVQIGTAGDITPADRLWLAGRLAAADRAAQAATVLPDCDAYSGEDAERCASLR